MKLIFLVVLLVFYMVDSAKRTDLALRRQLIFSFIGNCPKKHNLLVIFKNFSVEQIGKSEYVANGQFELTTDFPDGFKGKLLSIILIVFYYYLYLL